MNSIVLLHDKHRLIVPRRSRCNEVGLKNEKNTHIDEPHNTRS
jgi:hypothetical protein